MWYDFFKLFWYAFMTAPKDIKGGIVCGPFMPDLRGGPDIVAISPEDINATAVAGSGFCRELNANSTNEGLVE